MATGNERIFVQIPSDRDTECQWTIKDLFEKAKHPERIFVGVCWQFVPEEDQDCFKVVTRPEQVRTVEYHAKASRGACWARHMVQKLWQGEEYSLQIDSHMRFTDNWDARAIDMLHRCESPKPVLSAYSPGYEPPNKLEPPLLKTTIAHEFTKDGVFMPLYKTETIENTPASPTLNAFVNASFIFARAHLIEEVPYDPYLYFYGEEITLAARFWTHGWDIFVPNEVLLYHCFSRTNRPLHWKDHHQDWFKINTPAYARTRHLLGTQHSENPLVTKELDAYGLGTTRSLAEYQRFCGVDFKSKTISDNARRGIFPAFPPVVTTAPPPAPTLEQAKRGAVSDPLKPIKVFSSSSMAAFDHLLPRQAYDDLFRWAANADYRATTPTDGTLEGWRGSGGIVFSAARLTYSRTQSAATADDGLARLAVAVFDVLSRTALAAPSADSWQTLRIACAICPPGTGLEFRADATNPAACLYFLSPEQVTAGGAVLLSLPADNATPAGIGRYVASAPNRLVLLGRGGVWRLTPPAPGATPFLVVLGIFR